MHPESVSRFSQEVIDRVTHIAAIASVDGYLVATMAVVHAEEGTHGRVVRESFVRRYGDTLVFHVLPKLTVLRRHGGVITHHGTR